MQNNADFIKEAGVLAELAYVNDYFGSNPLKDSVSDDRLNSTYTVRATRDLPSGFQGMLLEELNVSGQGTGKYVFAFRGTEANHPISNFEQFYKDLIITDIGYMGTGTAPQQMKDAMSFVHEMIDNPDYSINATNTTFTGHSLGGSLASMASYVYGFDAYAYNGFGINNMLWDADDTGAVDHPNEMTPDEFGMSDTYQTLGEHLESLGVTVQGETNRTNNIIHVGYSRSDLVGGILTDIFSGQMGDTHFVVNHTGNSGGWFDNHDKVKLNESIAIYNNILTLFPDQNYNSLTEILIPVSPEDQKVERFLTSLGEIVSATPNSDHVTWSENISNSGVNNLTLTSLIDTSTASLQNQAGNPAYLYALLNLNPFAITGADYSHLNQNGALDSDNYSEKFIEDRAKFLYATTHENTDSIYYHDIERNIIVQAPSGTTIISKYIFGTEGTDELSGIAFGSGDDTLHITGTDADRIFDWRYAA